MPTTTKAFRFSTMASSMSVDLTFLPRPPRQSRVSGSTIHGSLPSNGTPRSASGHQSRAADRRHDGAVPTAHDRRTISEQSASRRILALPNMLRFFKSRSGSPKAVRFDLLSPDVRGCLVGVAEGRDKPKVPRAPKPCTIGPAGPERPPGPAEDGSNLS